MRAGTWRASSCLYRSIHSCQSVARRAKAVLDHAFAARLKVEAGTILLAMGSSKHREYSHAV